MQILSNLEDFSGIYSMVPSTKLYNLFALEWRNCRFCGMVMGIPTIYGLGPYIVDYLEKVLLACIVQGWCPRYVNFLA